ncbi:Serine/threonine-protein kinase PrkC [Planctomycetes bacterium Pan216]|uniref:Serine/threonine-protein kinase PrkC n=1 Tax=Kolteria novifilia TaxID=2527975 RepID=A0A518B8N4_9BACT|nr:Serine/threonine-protein kinase PrkC [Planctomycetes bacterium Pan216]
MSSHDADWSTPSLSILMEQLHEGIEGRPEYCLEALLRRYPRLAGRSADAVDLIYADFVLREDRGDRPSPSEYLERFEAYRGELAKQFEMHSALGDLKRYSSELPSSRRSTSREDLVSLADERFLVRRRLGAGSMGTVYLAEDRLWSQDVAVKVVGNDSSLLSERLRSEFRILASISHPNLVTYYELIRSGDIDLLTMEFVSGKSFREFVRGDAPPGERLVDEDGWARLTRLLAGLLSGLSHLHAAGIVHRDLKPSNVLVDDRGRPVLLDFGLATSTSEEIKLDRFAGTIAYMAPELLRCRPPTPESDLYAVGVMLHEVITGVPAQRQGFGKFADPAMGELEMHEGVSESRRILATMTRSLLQFDPAERPTLPWLLEQLGAARETSYPATRPSLLIGRERELDSLRAAYAEMRDGRSALIAITGTSGIGKTALVDHFLRSLDGADDPVILRGRCYETEDQPHKAWDAIASQMAARLDARKDNSPPEHRFLTRVFPVFQSSHGSGGDTAGFEEPPPVEARLIAYREFRDVISRLSASPLVIYIDDVQWADHDSLELLHHLLDDLDDPVLIVLCSRPDGERFDELCAEVRESRVSLTQLTLTELGIEDSRQLLANRLSDREVSTVVDEMVKASGGHPYLLTLLANEAGRGNEEVATSLDSCLSHAMGRLPASSRYLLELIAVAGQPVLLRELRDASAHLVDWQDSIAQLRKSSLVSSTGHAATSFAMPYHDKIRETIEAKLPKSHLTRRHLALAKAIEASSHADPVRLLRHYYRADDSVKAARYAERSGVKARDALAFASAADHFRLAIELAPDPASTPATLLEAHAECAANAGRALESAHSYVELMGKHGEARTSDYADLAALQFVLAGESKQAIRHASLSLRSHGYALPRTMVGGLLTSFFHKRRASRRAAAFCQWIDESEGEPSFAPATDRQRAVFTGWFVITVAEITYSHTVAHRLITALLEKPYSPFALVATTSIAMLDSIRLASSSVTSLCDKQVERVLGVADAVPDQDVATLARLIARNYYVFTGHWENAYRMGEYLHPRNQGASWLAMVRSDDSVILNYSLYYLGRLRELRELVEGRGRYEHSRDDPYTARQVRTLFGNAVYLCNDDADASLDSLAMIEANSQLHELASGQLGPPLYLARAETYLYMRRGDLAAALIRRHWYRIFALLSGLVFLVRFWVNDSLGRSDLARTVVDGRFSRLKRVERSAKRLVGERNLVTDAMASALQAGCASLRGDREVAIDAYERARELFESRSMDLHAHVMKRRVGELRGGDAGQHLVDEADAWMRGESIVRPDRFAFMIAPACSADDVEG